MDTPKPVGPRRELKSRNTAWARALARMACASGITIANDVPAGTVNPVPASTLTANNC